jgi:PAS domain-containing protein
VGIPVGVTVEHHPLLLVQARNLITNLALPTLLTGPDGSLLFFNDAAAVLLGRGFEEVGQLPRDEWAREFGPFDEHGNPIATDGLPLAQALREGRPTQGRFEIRVGDGLREVEVSAIPLVEPGYSEGAMVVIWPVKQAAPGTT